MARLHTTLLSLLLGVVAVLSLHAGLGTLELGAAASTPHVATVPAREIAARRAKLLRWSHALSRERARRPPALPRVPHFKAVHVPVAPPPAPPSEPSRVTYVQSPPVVRVTRTAPATKPTTTSGSSPAAGEGEHDDGGSGSDDGGGGD